ncbi:MAG: hypothetical protein LBC08_03075 [Campylobacteraceae bacterium]|jgi:hypothetical protein|nr:hypothetical protein [Campylobacteraceae bacterium]
MRRNSSYNQHIGLFFLALFLVVYQVFSGIYLFLSPLAGFFFVYITKNFKSDNIELYLAFAYLCFFELNHGFYLFSLTFLFALFYNFLKPHIEVMFQNELWIVTITVASAYMGLFVVNTFLAYMFGGEFFVFGIVYFFYIVIDTILALLLLRRYR